ncbi:hypothetical protein D9M69_431770 [compost metagenome]
MTSSADTLPGAPMLLNPLLQSVREQLSARVRNQFIVEWGPRQTQCGALLQPLLNPLLNR